MKVHTALIPRNLVLYHLTFWNKVMCVYARVDIVPFVALATIDRLRMSNIKSTMCEEFVVQMEMRMREDKRFRSTLM